MSGPVPQAADAGESLSVGGLFRRNGLALLAAGLITLAVELAALFLTRAMLPSRSAALTLLAGLLWVIVAAPVFAAGGRTALEALLRGGMVVDASLVMLAILAASNPALSVLGAVEVYLLYLAVAMLQCAGVLVARRVGPRHVLAAVMVLVVAVASAGPFWSNGILAAARGAAQQRVAAVVSAVNPVSAVLGCMDPGSMVVWSERPILYEYSMLGRDVPLPPAQWHVTALVYGLSACAVGGLAAWRRRGGGAIRPPRDGLTPPSPG